LVKKEHLVLMILKMEYIKERLLIIGIIIVLFIRLEGNGIFIND